MTEWRIQKQMVEQFASFREGFFEMVPKDLVGVFDERELEVYYIK